MPGRLRDRLVAIDVLRLGDVDLSIAREEGEGFRSVAEWRHAHERFWNEEVIPNLPGGFAEPLSDETRIVIERFRRG